MEITTLLRGSNLAPTAWSNDRGVTVVEYLVISAAVGLGLYGGLVLYEGSMEGELEDVGAEVAGISAGSSVGGSGGPSAAGTAAALDSVGGSAAALELDEAALAAHLSNPDNWTADSTAGAPPTISEMADPGPIERTAARFTMTGLAIRAAARVAVEDVAEAYPGSALERGLDDMGTIVTYLPRAAGHLWDGQALDARDAMREGEAALDRRRQAVEDTAVAAYDYVVEPPEGASEPSGVQTEGAAP